MDKNLSEDTLTYQQNIFASIFIMANRLQTACEKIQTNITMKQWLLLAIISKNENENNLTNLAKLMGCSRQNVRKLANPLVDKGYLTITDGDNNSIILNTTVKVEKYSKDYEQRHINTIGLLFEELTAKEITELFNIYQKLYSGIERVEEYGENLK